MASGRSALTVLAAAVAAACAPSTGLTDISESPAGAHEASLTPASDGFAVAWYDTRNGLPEIYLRMLDPWGRPLGPIRRLTRSDAAAYEADIASVSDVLVVGWYEKSPAGAFTPKIGAWSHEGEPRWQKTLASSGRNTVVRARGDTIFAAWIQDDGEGGASVWSGWWTAGGDELAAPVRLAAAGRTTWNLNAALDASGDAWIVFDASAGTGAEELFLVRTNVAGVPIVRQLTPDDGFASKYPDVALTDGRAALTWFDERDGNQEVYLAVLPAVGIGAGILSHARRVTETPGRSIGAYLAWNGARLGLAWCDDTDGQSEVYFQDFDSEGNVRGAVRQVASTPSASLVPAIRPWQSGFLLVWNEADLPADPAAHTGTIRSRIVSVSIP